VSVATISARACATAHCVRGIIEKIQRRTINPKVKHNPSGDDCVYFRREPVPTALYAAASWKNSENEINPGEADDVCFRR